MTKVKILYSFVAVVVVIGCVLIILTRDDDGTAPVACTMDIHICSDGIAVGRTGPDCQFVCAPQPTVAADIAAHIAKKANLIQLTTPVPNGVVESPMVVTGQARGTWFFEASFPVALTNWDGLIIAEGVAQATSDWMTEEFVPFTATLEFVSPYGAGAEDFMKRGALILKKDNSSGLPERDDALEIPVRSL